MTMSQVRRWLRRDSDFKANGRDNIRIPIYSSHCGQDWTPVTNSELTSHNYHLYPNDFQMDRLCMWMSLFAAILMAPSEDVMAPASDSPARERGTISYYWIINNWTLCIIDCIWFYFINTSIL